MDVVERNIEIEWFSGCSILADERCSKVDIFCNQVMEANGLFNDPSAIQKWEWNRQERWLGLEVRFVSPK